MRLLTRKFVRAFLPGVIKPLHVLWNEIIGFLFLVLAVFILFGTIRRTYGKPDSLFLMIAGIAFGLVLAGFGVSSFLRARRISRS